MEFDCEDGAMDMNSNMGDSWNNIPLKFWDDLIQLVQERPYLYTKIDARYKDTGLIKNTWEDIAESMDSLGYFTENMSKIDSEYIKAKWLSLRAKYLRERTDRKKPSGSGNDGKTCWVLYPYLEFLSDVIQKRNKKYKRTDSVNDIGSQDSQQVDSSDGYGEQLESDTEQQMESQTYIGQRSYSSQLNYSSEPNSNTSTVASRTEKGNSVIKLQGDNSGRYSVVRDNITGSLMLKDSITGSSKKIVIPASMEPPTTSAVQQNVCPNPTASIPAKSRSGEISPLITTAASTQSKHVTATGPRSNSPGLFSYAVPLRQGVKPSIGELMARSIDGAAHSLDKSNAVPGGSRSHSPGVFSNAAPVKQGVKPSIGQLMAGKIDGASHSKDPSNAVEQNQKKGGLIRPTSSSRNAGGSRSGSPGFFSNAAAVKQGVKPSIGQLTAGKIDGASKGLNNSVEQNQRKGGLTRPALSSNNTGRGSPDVPLFPAAPAALNRATKYTSPSVSAPSSQSVSAPSSQNVTKNSTTPGRKTTEVPRSSVDSPLTVPISQSPLLANLSASYEKAFEKAAAYFDNQKKQDGAHHFGMLVSERLRELTKQDQNKVQQRMLEVLSDFQPREE